MHTFDGEDTYPKTKTAKTTGYLCARCAAIVREIEAKA